MHAKKKNTLFLICDCCVRASTQPARATKTDELSIAKSLCTRSHFERTMAKSAHIARINTNHVTAGQNATLALALNKELRKKLRRGMVVLNDLSPTSTKEFDAEICVLKGDCTTIRQKYQAYVHILNVRQSAFAKRIELVKSTTDSALVPHSQHRHLVEENAEGRGTIVLRPGSRAKVRFEFTQRPEYIRSGI